jgi:periplasmic copper chaperone A
MNFGSRFLLIGVLGYCLVGAIQAGSVADVVRVDGAYARAVPPGQPNSAAFMVLHNTANTAHSLVSAESSVANVVELHTHVMEGDMMLMRQIDKIDLPAGGDVRLQPGGLHVMLIGLHQGLAPKDQVPLTLIYDDGSRQSLQLPVRAIESTMEHHLPAR